MLDADQLNKKSGAIAALLDGLTGHEVLTVLRFAMGRVSCALPAGRDCQAVLLATAKLDEVRQLLQAEQRKASASSRSPWR